MNSQELPDCFYDQNQPTLISPKSPTPKHCLYLSNLDDQSFLRFSAECFYAFSKSVSSDVLKDSLSRVLVDYYPLAGRVRPVKQNGDDHKLEVDCNGEGAVFAEGFMDISLKDFLVLSQKPNKSWRKLLYSVQAHTFLDIPPLVVQVTKLRCGGMILCTAINHCLCDGTGASQFKQAWAYVARTPTVDHLPIQPFLSRHLLKPRDPPQVTHSHPAYQNTKNTPEGKTVDTINIGEYLLSLPLSPASLTFAPSHILRLKKRCDPLLKCTAFEALASHTWRSWVRSLDLPLTANVKLIFSVNVRNKLIPKLPQGYFGNGIVLACAESTVKDLVNRDIGNGAKLVREAKSKLTDGYIRSNVDLLEDTAVKPDLWGSLVISQWSKMGLENLDFGEGQPVYINPLPGKIYCNFLPVVGNSDAVRVHVSLPETVVEKFERYMTEFSDGKDNGGF